VFYPIKPMFLIIEYVKIELIELWNIIMLITLIGRIAVKVP